MAVIMSFHAEKWHHLVNKHEASASTYAAAPASPQ